jgi:cell wall-associated NlpC family hydrolase
MHAPSNIQRWLSTAALVFIAALLLACGTGSLTASREARWACPSPTPWPYGTAGPVKREWQECTPDPITGALVCETKREYYLEWEQEYASLGGPPFPSPTPYAIRGTTFLLGQRVEVGGFHVTADASADPLADRAGVAPGTQQLYFMRVTWLNHTGDPIPINYAERVRLREIRAPSGARVTDARWGMNALSLELSGMSWPPDQIPPGESSVTIPIIAPPGTPTTVEIIFDADSAYIPNLPTSTVGSGTPTTPPAPEAAPTTTPPPNLDLRDQQSQLLTVQWTDGSLRGIGPPCDDPGVTTSWEDGRSVAWGRHVDLSIAAPPGASRLIQIVLNQVGKRYIWGAKGPEAFDCSGLASWSYAQIGIVIPQGSGGQWPNMHPATPGELQPGDLVFFDIQGSGRIDHVGVLVGDLNGDGTWDMVHAASPELGVRVDYAIFESAYYAPRIRGFRTARS